MGGEIACKLWIFDNFPVSTIGYQYLHTTNNVLSHMHAKEEEKIEED